VPALLECLDEVILAFGKNACEYREVLRLDGVGKLSRRANRARLF
jgi:hypothetical protein